MMKKIDKLRMSRYAMVWGMLFSALWLFAVAPLQAQTEQDKVLAEQGTKTQVHQEAKKIFVNMPDSLSPLLTAVNRADCIDFLESKMKAKVENRFGRESEMTELSKDYIRVQMTPQSTWQMKLLATSDTTQVICTVSTACAPVCDSNIQFYTTDWKELPISDFITAMPAMDDFFETPDSAAYEYNHARLQADMLLMKIDLSASDNTLTFTLTTPEYMEKETADKLKPFIRRPILRSLSPTLSVGEGVRRYSCLFISYKTNFALSHGEDWGEVSLNIP